MTTITNGFNYTEAAIVLERAAKDQGAPIFADCARLLKHIDIATKLIEADAIACEQEAEAFKAKNDGINAYLMSTQAMAHRLDLKRLKP